jgi:pullulanase-type alpha-1,6-glucosidase
MHRASTFRSRPSSRRRRRGTALLSGTAVVAALLVPVAVAAPAVAADPPPSVTLVGTMQHGLGCRSDWDPMCAATDLTPSANGTWSASFALPAGSYAFKYAVNRSWDTTYGGSGKANQGEADNIPLTLAGPAAVTFTFDATTHLGTLTPTAAQPGLTAADRQRAGNSLREDLTRERFYFVMTDRFANADPANDTGGYPVPAGADPKFVTGYDPTDKGFYHGGDLKGITGKLDYIKGMGTTAIWLTPSFKNNPVQHYGTDTSAGYHGYWITDFTQIDPHLGTNADLKNLIDAAHDKGMKVFFDIITNHTGDVIQTPGTYISKEQQPYRDASGKTFDDRDFVNGDTFPTLDANTSFPYVPTFATEAAKTAKTPAWLNDPIYYHNRGNAAFKGDESDVYGDFSGNDDLFTENPTVRDGMIDIYSYWAKFGIDGFRIDTVKHVDTEFWQKFVPATRAAAASAGKPKFFEFGEVYDANPAKMSYYDTTGGLQATLDFGFQAQGVGFATGKSTDQLAALYADDDYYTDADSNAYQLPTFLGNHDMGRVGYFLQHGGVPAAEQLPRDLLAQQLMYLTRGQPVTYYGDEQGFTGDGGDKDARQDMFASKVASYNDDTLIGSSRSTATDNFNTSQPIYSELAQLAKLRDANPALADGAQIPRYSSNQAGVFAVSRIDARQQVEYVVALNNATTAKTVGMDVFNADTNYSPIWGSGKGAKSTRDGRITVTVPPLSATVLKAAHPLAASKKAPGAVFGNQPGSTVGGRAKVSVAVPQGGFNQVTFAWRAAGTSAWTTLGTDDNQPYAVYHDVGALAKGTLIEYRAVVKDNSGNLSLATTSAVVGDPAPTTSAGAAKNDRPATQPTSVTVAGTMDSELGCGADWKPDCAAAHLTYDSRDGIWKGAWQLPAGSYDYKAAINDNWTENYGAGGVSNGGNITVTVPDDQLVHFYYDPATHWITSDVQNPIVTAPGDFQAALGCGGDWAPDCLRPWLQDPDGDGTYTFSTAQIPAGTWNTKAAVGLSWDENYGAGGTPNGANITFTVGANAVVTFSYVAATHVLTVTSTGNTSADLTKSKAQWLSANWIAWDLPATANQWHYRLHYAAAGGLGLDSTAVTGGSSVPLTLGALPAALVKAHPNLAGYDGLQLPSWAAQDRNLLQAVLKGQVVVAAYDDAGRLMDATGVQLPWVLDDVYAAAQQQPLGLQFVKGLPTFRVWAPTAQKVQLLVTPPGSPKQLLLPMIRDDRSGIWYGAADPRWKGGTYRYRVTVYVPDQGKVVVNDVTDPYSVALTTNSTRSVIADLSDPTLKPAGWDKLAKPQLPQPAASSIYELHVRDFSIGDTTVPAAHRGTYLAFTDTNSAGMQHLRQLAQAGMNTLHLLPVFDIATIEEDRSKQAVPNCDLPALTAADPAGEQQQACTSQVADTDGYNWGYDPLHYTTPEGSYATNPDGAARTKEFRQMVQGINGAGLRVVMDVVYNHTAAAGEDPKSVLDQIVPGYYQRLSATGALETSTCCANTATEHAMMGKLVVDSVVTWAKQYKIDGFRFDLMGHMPKANLLAVRAALDKLTLAKDGVNGKQIYLYGEGWNFGEVADNALFVQASQANMAGTGIGTFNDRLRDAVRGAGPFDDNPGKQGFGTGLFTDPNVSDANGSAAEQRATLLHDQDLVKIGLTGNLGGYSFVDATGATVTGRQVDYNGQPAGYTAQPSETINYVDAHDNETLFDVLTYKLPVATSMADRVRMNTLSLATVALGQGPMFWHAGADLLRSKSLDRDSFNSGDWFNRIDWTGQRSTFGSGLPPKAANSAKWDYMRPLLANPALKPAPADIASASAQAEQLLRLRTSSPLFTLGTAALVQQKLSFLGGGPDQTPGVIAMQIDDRVGPDVDPALQRIVVVFNGSPSAQTVPVAGASGLRLSPVQSSGPDAVVRGSTVSASAVTVPARTVAVFVQ